ncbi:YlqD family protein [Bacillus songklensis]|uniref:YlqD family protein n=1 Tax=Bacillus songklensis TaxID=1069116 RepID=A0ABV8AX89_9BACI
MRLLQKVIVKQILTEKSKDALFNRFQEQKEQLHKEIDQLRFQMKKIEKNKKWSSSLLESRFEKEQESRLEKIRILDFQMDQLQKLPVGSELVEKEMEGVADVKVGDRWEDVNAAKTIIVKDGIIVEIR